MAALVQIVSPSSKVTDKSALSIAPVAPVGAQMHFDAPGVGVETRLMIELRQIKVPIELAIDAAQ